MAKTKRQQPAFVSGFTHIIAAGATMTASPTSFQSVASFTILANSMGPNTKMTLDLYFDFVYSLLTTAYIQVVIDGGTTLYSTSKALVGGSTSNFMVQLAIYNQNSQNSQYVTMKDYYNGLLSKSNLTVDTTKDHTIAIQAKVDDATRAFVRVNNYVARLM